MRTLVIILLALQVTLLLLLLCYLAISVWWHIVTMPSIYL